LHQRNKFDEEEVEAGGGDFGVEDIVVCGLRLGWF
jgi:hypothetical protein